MDDQVRLDPEKTAQRYAPLIAARADEVERVRRLPADLAADLAEAGLFGLLVPKSLGGAEVSPGTFIRVLETLARADASVAWCVMIGATTGLTAAYLPRAEAERVFADSSTITGGVFAPLGRAVEQDGVYRVSGRWAWASGSANCRWLMGGAMIKDGSKPKLLSDGRPQHRMMVFPRQDAQLIDTWQAWGLKGTGSGDMEVDQIAVPKARSVSLIDDRPWADGALYAFPAFGLLALGVAAVASGNATAALQEARTLLMAKKAAGGKKTLAERATIQAGFAEAEAGLAAAQAFLQSAVGEAWRRARSEGVLDLPARARLRLAATHLVRTAADVCRTAFDLGGGTSVYLTSPLQRRFRDGHTVTQHIMVAPANYETVGRVLLDVPGDVTTL